MQKPKLDLQNWYRKRCEQAKDEFRYGMPSRRTIKAPIATRSPMNFSFGPTSLFGYSMDRIQALHCIWKGLSFFELLWVNRHGEVLCDFWLSPFCCSSIYMNCVALHVDTIPNPTLLNVNLLSRRLFFYHRISSARIHVNLFYRQRTHSNTISHAAYFVHYIFIEQVVHTLNPYRANSLYIILAFITYGQTPATYITNF
jgi:hypothetical protein